MRVWFCLFYGKERGSKNYGKEEAGFVWEVDRSRYLQERGMSCMGINVKVQRSEKQENTALFYVKQDKELQDCMHCKYFYGNSRQCLARHCTKELAEPQKQEDKDSPCYGCSYKKQEGYCFPCMKRLLGKGGMEWSA